eukprot:TRINITY_DN47263_c0_g1_i1.p1 TRINITY_DN47263_c0_g1~~TRINITY_DN47263_c0_g1_i1.p1  ORF type:complete len:633 (-),score=77.67 TRINITY_DN47263_c0_g1_i1:719-2617(-)
MGNKGAVAVRFRVYDSSFLVFCCHLPSGESDAELSRRNWALAEIFKRCQFTSPSFSSRTQQQQMSDVYRSMGVSIAPGAGEGDGQWRGVHGLEDHEHVILLGDMNYRVDENHKTAIKLVRKNQLSSLFLRDQLVNEMERETILQGWTEGILTFPPTYKFVKGTDLYHGENNNSLEDVRSVRTPSWTDRVIFISAGGLHQLEYSCGSLKMSDHKPVFAAFLSYVKEYNKEKVMEAIHLARKASDAQENASIPEITLSSQIIDVGDVYYGKSVVRNITIENTGQVPAVYSIVAAPNETVVQPPWLTLTPRSSLIAEGCSIEVKLKVSVQGGIAEQIVSEHDKKLDAILVLGIGGGREFFISVSGKYIPSFFGLSFSTLRQLDDRQGVFDRFLLGQSELRESQQVLDSIPWQLKAISSALFMGDGMSSEGIFVRSQAACEVVEDVVHKGSISKDIEEVRSLLETGRTLEGCQPHAVAATMLVLFKVLPHPFMPQTIIQMCNVMVPNLSSSRKLLQQEMAEVDYAILLHMLRLMRCVLLKKSLNKVLPRQLARMLAGVWFPPVIDPNEEGYGSSDTIQERLRISDHVWQTRTDFILQFIQVEQDNKYGSIHVEGSPSNMKKRSFNKKRDQNQIKRN